MTECRVPYCHRRPWANLLACKKHTLLSRRHMQKQRDKKRAVGTKRLERMVARKLFEYGFSARHGEVVAESIVAKVAAHINRTRRRRAG